MMCQLDFQRLMFCDIISQASEGNIYAWYCMVKNLGSNQVMEVFQGKDEIEAELVQYEMHGGANQVWRFTSKGYLQTTMGSKRVADCKGGFHPDPSRGQPP